ncbi:MAG TPA: aminopeptidase [Candidatus Aminicenantes bacterium]|nr:aminopeptidase [Candidatus Aminicenantes bacterium]HRY64729.1 aminopeptidase [Candidatus Aminicenantes bacterium]HRZ71642.1 aminopeptidase [Candidatus Aminicenantes bacterium]
MIPKDRKLYAAADRAVNQALRLRRGERFLLVTDTPKLEIAEALAFHARRAGAEVTTYLMTETLRPITGPTRQFRELIRGAGATAYLLEGRFPEKPFRGFMVAEGAKHGRVCMMPGITRDMMERLVAIDFSEMARFTGKVMKAVEGADDIVVENAAGTRISFSVRGRRWKADVGDISRKGRHGNLPAGECFTCPVEETFTGRIVIGLIDDKLGRGEMTFKEGKLVGFKGAGVAEVIKTVGDDPAARVIGEFGIGTNKGARLSPNMLEAEKALGTVHFAIGDSYGLGKNKSKFHFDALVDKATLKVGGRAIARDGKFLV